MRVEVLSDTKQKFNGQTYYLCGRYFSNAKLRPRRLHQAVWEFFNGPAPAGLHIHHIDEDRSNNQIDNLEIKVPGEHLKIHWTADRRAKQKQYCLEVLQPKAAKWHGSSSGLSFHSDLAKEVWKTRERFPKICEFCGKDYLTPFPNRSRFCHQNCKASARRRRRGY